MRFSRLSTSSVLVTLLATSETVAAASCSVRNVEGKPFLVDWDIWASNVYGSAQNTFLYLFLTSTQLQQLTQILNSRLVRRAMGQSQEQGLRPFRHVLRRARVITYLELAVQNGYWMSERVNPWRVVGGHQE
ncbi:uncharacterized protein SETTUDRAFT_34696 [Exserohilum turcica Et28A]|uniref:Uncharacterized protein n=1 Tax=Exserohilum turcicum (strain 28A) TaxID=671987 RepID=R0I8T6_EXST2|nr:uncharacterized protein SETTUDRAFT_34696 [Exserohilum turcica Et28A]EOA81930.1 hypothetical protein SETTUDRAFT_34696 [Exserohilum turcica Et28A]